MWRARGELMVRRRYYQRHGHVPFDRLRITGAHRPDRVEVFMLLTPKCCDRVPVLVNHHCSFCASLHGILQAWHL